MNLRTIMQLTRIEHSVMLMLGVLIIVLLLDIQPSYDKLLYTLLCPFFISAGAFALNDYFDAESDKINKKDRPIVRNEISKSNALKLAILLIVIGVGLAYPLRIQAFSIAVIFAVLSILYDWKLKDIALIGNIIIAASMSIVFIFTEIAFTENLSQLTMLIALTSFLSGLGREIQKTVQDIEGDVKARYSKTLPVLIGKSLSLHISLILIVLASGIAVYIFFTTPPLKSNYLYFVPMLCSIAGLAYSTYLFYGNKEMQETGRKISLYSLILGLLAYLFGGI